jgi:hypothetical protein
LLLAIGLIAGSIIYTKSQDFTDTNTQQSCNDALIKDIIKNQQNYKEGADCHVWDGSQCRKGKFDKQSCVSQGKSLPIILLGVGVVCLVSSVIVGVIYMRS